MFATLQPHVVGFWTPDKPQESMLFPPKSGTVISTLHHQQLHIHQHHPPPTSINYKSTSHTLKSLLNQDLSLADAKSSKEKCAKCSAALCSNTVPVRGSVCSKGFHQKCSTGPKALTCDNLWKCQKWTSLQQNHTSESTNCQLPGSTNSSPSQPLPATSRNNLKTYQWNTDGIHPKFIEVRNHLINSDINVLVVQKSKLWKTDKTPFIEGYATIRKDQNNILGGGLLLFIQNDIMFEKLLFQKSWYGDPVHSSQGY